MQQVPQLPPIKPNFKILRFRPINYKTIGSNFTILIPVRIAYMHLLRLNLTCRDDSRPKVYACSPYKRCASTPQCLSAAPSIPFGLRLKYTPNIPKYSLSLARARAFCYAKGAYVYSLFLLLKLLMRMLLIGSCFVPMI